MSFPSFHPNSNQEASPESPFSIFIAHTDIKRGVVWKPEAFVKLTKSLRTSGFLLTLPPEDLKSFLFLLTFLTPSGHCATNLIQLASALHLSPQKARARLERLLLFRWQGKPIVLSHQADNGAETFMLAPGFVPVVEDETPTPASTPIKAVPREVVIEQSRRLYGRPRPEVERQIAKLNDWTLPQEALNEVATSHTDSNPIESQKGIVRQELLRIGLLAEQADDLLNHFDLVRIQRQLMWLPYRAVRNRAGFLLAAVKDDYAAPLHWHRTTAIPEKEQNLNSGDES